MTKKTDGPKTLLIDIETAPAQALIWDMKTRYVPYDQIVEDGYILCFAAGWLGEPTVEFASRWDQGYEWMVQRAWELLDEADVVIHYNGNNFDIPRLNSEFLVNRMGPPSPAHHVDLYRTVAGKFRVISRSMRHMLHLLGLESKLKHKGIELWVGCMTDVAGDQKVMQQYNVQDVIVLEDLYHELLPWIDNHPNVALWMKEGPNMKCPNCGSEDLENKGYKHTRVLSYKQFRCHGCGFYPRVRFAKETGKSRRGDILT